LFRHFPTPLPFPRKGGVGGPLFFWVSFCAHPPPTSPGGGGPNFMLKKGGDKPGGGGGWGWRRGGGGPGGPGGPGPKTGGWGADSPSGGAHTEILGGGQGGSGGGGGVGSPIVPKGGGGPPGEKSRRGAGLRKFSALFGHFAGGGHGPENQGPPNPPPLRFNFSAPPGAPKFFYPAPCRWGGGKCCFVRGPPGSQKTKWAPHKGGGGWGPPAKKKKKKNMHLLCHPPG